MTRQWWISFVSEAGFAGACVVEGNLPDVASALRAAWTLEINPGGEAMAIEIEPGNQIKDKSLLHKLFLDPADVEKYFGSCERV
jgi:hypothetical protein